MTLFPSKPLGELVDIFDHIRVPLSAAQRSTRGGPYPYYGAQNVIDHIDDYLFEGRYLLIPEDGENLNSRKLPIAYFADGRFWVNNHAHIVRGKEGEADDVFLKHAINSLDIRPYVTGAAQPKLNQANLKRIQLPAPSYAEQCRIGSILGAYDDLIAVNVRRIGTLEKMAQCVFGEWFVDFRFPGNDASSTDRIDGSLPEGWHPGTLSDIAAQTGQSVSPMWEPDTEFALFSIPAFDEGHTPSIEPGSAIMSNKTSFEPPVVLVSKLNPRIRRVWHVADNDGRQSICSSEFVALAAKEPFSSSLIYVIATERTFGARLAGMSSGTSTSHQRVKPADILSAPVVIPPDDLVRSANALIEPLCLSALNLRRSNCLLVKARDHLVERLVTGRLNMSQAERELESASNEAELLAAE
jgi:type I restriction enzyme S subunit